MLILPFVAVIFDKNDYRDIKENIHVVDDRLMRRLAIRK
jgi:hypothetical protein